MNSKIEICNAALVLLGAEPISSFEEDTRQSSISGLIYDNTYRDNLQSSLWVFSLKRSDTLNLLSGVSKVDFNERIFNYAYQLPTDFLRLAGTDTPNVKYQIMGTNICSTSQISNIIYQCVPEEKHLPDHFKRLLILDLCSIYAVSLLNNTQTAAYYNGLKEKQLVKCRGIDSTLKTSQNVPFNEYSIVISRA